MKIEIESYGNTKEEAEYNLSLKIEKIKNIKSNFALIESSIYGNFESGYKIINKYEELNFPNSLE